MRLRARTDAGHKAIVAALRKVGCKVSDTSRVGQGFPDLVVRAPGSHYDFVITPEGKRIQTGYRVLLMEVKELKGKLTPDQETFIAAWPETVIVRSVEDALAAVGCEVQG